MTIETVADRELRCPSCDHLWKLEGRVVDLLEQPKEKVSRGQRLMESSWFVAAYESRFIRRNPLMRMLMGLSFEKESRLLRRIANIQGAERVLDIACGTGNHTRRFAKATSRGMVVGLDLSQPMLEEAGRRAREAEIRNVFFVRGDALTLPFEDAAFDVVSCAAGMHLISPLSTALGEMNRVLRPGGKLVASMPRRSQGRWLGKIARGVGEPLGIHPFAPGELEELWAKAGFTNIVVHHAFRTWQVLGGEKPRD